LPQEPPSLGDVVCREHHAAFFYCGMNRPTHSLYPIEIMLTGRKQPLIIY